MSNSKILNYQLDKFREVMEHYTKKREQRIIFIHGKGDGVSPIQMAVVLGIILNAVVVIVNVAVTVIIVVVFPFVETDEAVSYTHLDVYKRQLLTIIGRITRQR